MPKIYIKFNTAVIKEMEIIKDEMTIGRKPGNDIVIDNPAVSGFHGKIVKDGEHFYIEDLNSTNGTFVNGQRVKKTQLRDKDQIGVARHVLEFVLESAPTPPPPAPPSPTVKTVIPATTEKPKSTPNLVNREDQLEILRQSLGLTPKNPGLVPAEKPAGEPVVQKESVSAPPPTPLPDPSDPQAASGVPTTPITQAVIKIIAGSVNNQTEVKLKDLVTYIGTSDQAAIKIKGLLAPSLAAAISRRPDGYFLKAVKAGYPKVNGNPVTAQVFLENGALIEAGATNMVFSIPNPDKTPK